MRKSTVNYFEVNLKYFRFVELNQTQNMMNKDE
ncbi:hypothetical protein SAMN05421857_1415 [Chryseobacterium formosense]|nr:hypothetical protein SAMN05421857_1415 [Chryseobacterium formosense]